MPEFRNACLQEYAKDALIGSFPLPPSKPIFENTQINTNFKTVQKSCLENFQINLKIN